jgi:hypothetical protein
VRPARAALISLGILGAGILGFAGLSLSKMAGVVGVGASYDMDPAQVKAFVAAAAIKKGWKPVEPIERSAEPKPGEMQSDFSADLLPWMTARLRVNLTPEKNGTHVQISGHATKVKELKASLDDQLPALAAP